MSQVTPRLWMQALCNGSVLHLYQPNAVLVPTFGAGAVQGTRAIAAYLKKFSGDRPGLCGSIDSTIVEQLDADVTVYSGTYSFRWRGGSAKARYTFVVTPDGIETQHSSAMP